jgi:RNA recognition motif-containing protein
MNIKVSNLSTQMNNEELRNLFTSFGQVQSAEIAMDAFTDRSRGFGYVEMENDDQAKSAISSLNNKEFNGTVLSVEQTEPKVIRRGSYKVGNGAIQAYKFRKN